MANNTAVKRSRGRPRTNVKWVGIGVRFVADEKPRLARASRKQGMSQAKFIRHATLSALEKSESGKLD